MLSRRRRRFPRVLATWWIRQAVARALADKARTIRIPVHVVEKLNRVGRAERKLVTGLGREPTAEEIGEVTSIESEQVELIRRFAQAPISLEKPVGDEEQSELGELIADEQAESPYERAVETLTKETLRDALENLSYRERRVLELRYASATSTRAHSTRSRAHSTSRASASAKSRTRRSRSYRTSAKPSSCATTSRSLRAFRCARSVTEPRPGQAVPGFQDPSPLPTRQEPPLKPQSDRRRRVPRPGIAPSDPEPATRR